MKKATTLVVVGKEHSLSHLRSFISAHQSHRPVQTVALSNFSSEDLNQAAAVLIIGGPDVSSPFLRAANGRRVVAGCLPEINDRLHIFDRTAAEVQRRTGQPSGPFVILGEAEERALTLAGRLKVALGKSAPTFQWTAERLTQSDLTSALRLGPGAAFYVGRGAPQGWACYGGFNAADARLACGHPLGAVFSLTCSVARRPQDALSFAEEIVLSGLAAATLGATDFTLHTDNIRLGISIARALRGKVSTLADLLLSPEIPPSTLQHYRVIGDPLAPLIGHPDSLAKAQQVFAPAPDEVLPEIPLSSWA